ncbi:MAG: glutamate-1-semialdehyde 2,1-aminomutase [Alphaproteobacteria bacterium]|nr:glutamate-1-semialdehyde 2,1-aminomutase [Alphaproteobacteria bacterium]
MTLDKRLQEQNESISDRLHHLIPGGCHTYSKGDDQFPENAPHAISHGKGAEVWDLEQNRFIDCSMGLTAVSIGHGYEPVAKAVAESAYLGTNFQRPALLELEAAEIFLDTVQSGDMVKFAKNGSTVTTAAVKLARAYTNKNKVALAKEHNFFSFDDWFIASTACDFGVEPGAAELSVKFSYNDLASVEQLFADPDHDIACLIMEPTKFDPPTDDFLNKVGDICRANGVVYILDEMVSGFKWHIKGAQHHFNVEPDLSTWGKGMANGFSACALTGKREIMELGGVRNSGERKLFLISSTHGAESTGLAAMIETIRQFEQHDMFADNWRRGQILQDGLRKIIAQKNMTAYLQVLGDPCLFVVNCLNHDLKVDSNFRTLLLQEMIRRNILFQGLFYPTWSHNDAIIHEILEAFDASLNVYAEALDNQSTSRLLIGEAAKPVFRKFI